MIKEVFLIFKTHLDVGYTDYAENVINTYYESFIPSAIKTGYQLKDTDTPFKWSVGSWLIWEGLKRDKDKSLEKAINDGIIAWHGLPFTTHTEIMSEKLFDYGLSLSKKLDERFGKKTIGAKMTDVPGHTKGMVPHMCRAGLKFLHLGINSGTPVPPVPNVFKWKCGDDEIVVMYQDTYGTTTEFDDFAICFGHTSDNRGVQSIEQIKKIYADIRAKYPGAVVKAATLDDVAEKMVNLKDLPVLDKEIGDTWIHGVATDPKKLGMYRELLRCIEDRDISDYDFCDNLLLVPEHTWGMNLKRYFPDTENWYNEDLERVRETEACKAFERSWVEQREYVKKASEILGVDADYKLSEPDLSGYEPVKDKQPCFELSWQLFDQSDYQRFMDGYVKLTVRNVSWNIWDYLKLGMPMYDGGIYAAKTVAAYQKGDSTLYRLEFDDDIKAKFGLPYVWACELDGKLEIKWFGKKASRLPQAFWLKFKGCDEAWEISKMGQWISPENIVGSPLITATDKGIRNKDTEIISLDAALVAPFGRRLLDYDENPSGKDLYFNLYNNIWNTNFPMWYSDDTRFRFEIKKK